MADNRKIESKADEGERSGRGSTDDLHGRVAKKDVAKAYEKYAERFTPKPRYFFNSLKAFATGGMICTASLWLERKFMAAGVPEQDAGICVVIVLIMAAQLLTGLGWFDRFCQFHGGACAGI